VPNFRKVSTWIVQFKFLRSTLSLIMPRVRNPWLDSNQLPIYAAE
jgi:hypothetical protein